MIKVKDLLKVKGYNVVTVKLGTKVCDAMNIMHANNIGSVVVLDEQGQIAGLLTERDILYCEEGKRDFTHVLVEDLMTPADKLIIASPNDRIQYAMAMMTEYRIKHIPVIENNKLVGIISIGDIVKALLDHSEQKAKRLQDYLSGKYPEE